MSMAKSLVTTALSGALVFGTPGIVSGGAPLSAPTVDPSSGPPGTTITISGSGCVEALFPQGDNGIVITVTVTVQFVPTPVQTTTNANPDGTWSVQVVVPADAQPGTVPVNATCNDPFNSLGSAGEVGPAQAAPGVYPAASFTVTAAPVVAQPTSTG